MSVFSPVIFAILTGALLVAVYTDLKSHRIYNWLTFPTILIGILLHALTGGGHGLFFAFGGIAVASLALLLCLFSGAMGAGDVKLLWAVGALAGPAFTAWTLLFTAIAGGVCGILYAAQRGVLTHTLRNAMVGGHALTDSRSPEALQGMALTSKAGKMPYAPAIALGVALVALLSHAGIL